MEYSLLATLFLWALVGYLVSTSTFLYFWTTLHYQNYFYISSLDPIPLLLGQLLHHQDCLHFSPLEHTPSPQSLFAKISLLKFLCHHHPLSIYTWISFSGGLKPISTPYNFASGTPLSPCGTILLVVHLNFMKFFLYGFVITPPTNICECVEMIFVAAFFWC